MTITHFLFTCTNHPAGVWSQKAQYSGRIPSLHFIPVPAMTQECTCPASDLVNVTDIYAAADDIDLMLAIRTETARVVNETSDKQEIIENVARIDVLDDLLATLGNGPMIHAAPGNAWS